MKPTLDIQHQGTIDTADSVKMTFDENSIAHLMSVLTDLYSDPVTAVIREYSTNARDAQQEAGFDGPILITLPNALQTTFVVEDCGVGMTATQIKEQFSKYGWSSKRDSDTQTGMLGLGCKSGLAYAGQFTFYSTKDGTTSIVLVSRDPDGAASLQVLDESYTGQPNGTKIEIPVKNSREFIDKATAFFQFWRPGTVKFSDRPHNSLWECKDPENDKWGNQKIVRVDDGIIAIQGFGSSYILMGGVPYPVAANHGLADIFMGGGYNYSSRSQAYGVICEVEIGSVNFTPSREALQYTKRTEELLKDLNEYLVGVFGKALSDRVARCTTATSAWRAYNENANELAAFGIPRTWRGLDIPEMTINSPSPFWDVDRVRSATDRVQRHNYPMRFGPERNSRSVLIVSNHPFGKAVSSNFKDKLREFVRLNNDVYRDVTSFKLFTQVLDEQGVPFDFFKDQAPWLDHLHVVDYDTINAVSLDKRQRKKYEEKFIDGSFTQNRLGGSLPTIVRLEELRPQHRRMAWVGHHDAKLVENRQGMVRLIAAINSHPAHGTHERKYKRFDDNGALIGWGETHPIICVVNASEQSAFEDQYPDVPHISTVARELIVSVALHEPVGVAMQAGQDVLFSQLSEDKFHEHNRRWSAVKNMVNEYVKAYDKFFKFADLTAQRILDPELTDLLEELPALTLLSRNVRSQNRYGASAATWNAAGTMKELGSMDDQEDEWEIYRCLAIEIMEIRTAEIEHLPGPMLDMVARYPLVSQLTNTSSVRVICDYLNALWLVSHGFQHTPHGAAVGSYDHAGPIRSKMMIHSLRTV